MVDNIKVTNTGKLADYVKKLAAQKAKIDVGFFQGAHYDDKDSTQVVKIAAQNEYGNIINVPAHTVTNYKEIDDGGRYKHKGRFVKKEKANYAEDFAVEAYDVVIPARPFMHQTFKKYSPDWKDTFYKYLKQYKYDVKKSMNQMGLKIQGQIQDTISNGDFVPNAASTVAQKGKNTPLKDSLVMQRSVKYNVTV